MAVEMTATVTPEQAAQMFVDLKNRVINPKGTFDKAGRFYLDNHYSCCAGIRFPSRRWPYSEMVHGRTAQHVACETSVDVKLIRKLARQIERI